MQVSAGLRCDDFIMLNPVGNIRLVLVLFYTAIKLSVVSSTHFRGGIIMMRPQPGGSEFEVSPIDSQSMQVEHWHAIYVLLNFIAETTLWYEAKTVGPCNTVPV